LELLKGAGFHRNGRRDLEDDSGRPVEFSLVTSASNPERVQMAAIIQDDLKQIGVRVQVVPLEFRVMVDKVLNKREFEACLLSLGNGDADPNAEMNVWISSGATHLWNPSQKEPATEWEREVDGLMRQQLVTLDYSRRKKLYDRVQEIVAENVPMIFLTSPNVLVAARRNLGNFSPAVLDHHTLWNADRLYLTSQAPDKAK
jgi:peptide/nickel transport system substrate-binding protein